LGLLAIGGGRDAGPNNVAGSIILLSVSLCAVGGTTVGFPRVRRRAAMQRHRWATAKDYSQSNEIISNPWSLHSAFNVPGSMLGIGSANRRNSSKTFAPSAGVNIKAARTGVWDRFFQPCAVPLGMNTHVPAPIVLTQMPNLIVSSLQGTPSIAPRL